MAVEEVGGTGGQVGAFDLVKEMGEKGGGGLVGMRG